MRLGDLDLLEDGLKCHYQSTDEKYETDRQWAVGYNAGLNRALHSITYAKTIDAVPVVRCKDCKHYKPPKVSAHYVNHTKYCTRVVTMKVSPDSFCSYGERKDGENVDGGLAGRPETV